MAAKIAEPRRAPRRDPEAVEVLGENLVAKVLEDRWLYVKRQTVIPAATTKGHRCNRVQTGA